MKRTLLSLLVLTLIAGGLSACGGAPAAPASVSGETAPVDLPDVTTLGDPAKKMILVVSFGTSYNDTRAVTIDAIEAAIADAYPDYEVRRAFTSQMIINKLASRDGLKIDNVTEAMERLVADGVGTLIVQPTHVMNGLEYDDLMAEIAPYAGHFVSVSYGQPLLTITEDYFAVAEALIDAYAPAEDTALVLMGHGTSHYAGAAYAALDYTFKDMGHANVFVGTVEGYPEIDSVLKWVNAGGYEKVTLAPLMVVAGDHASNDMAGDDEDAWKSIFTAAGKSVTVELKGMGEIEGIRAIYASHIERAVSGEAQ